MLNVMIDLETLSTANNAVILSIGACTFDPTELFHNRSSFHEFIDPADCVSKGLVMDPSTVMWWLEQGNAARASLARGQAQKVPLQHALARFTDWYRSLQGPHALPPIWGNGAMFDNVILINAYKAAGMPYPWTHKEDRCYRTLKQLFPDPCYMPPANEDAKHDALTDAQWQAAHATRIMTAWGLK